MLGIFAQHTGFVVEVPELHAEAKTVYNEIETSVGVKYMNMACL